MKLNSRYQHHDVTNITVTIFLGWWKNFRWNQEGNKFQWWCLRYAWYGYLCCWWCSSCKKSFLLWPRFVELLFLTFHTFFLDGPKAAEIRARKMNRGWMQRNKVGPDGFLQLSLQLASYRLTGNWNGCAVSVGHCPKSTIYFWAKNYIQVVSNGESFSLKIIDFFQVILYQFTNPHRLQCSKMEEQKLFVHVRKKLLRLQKWWKL